MTALHSTRQSMPTLGAAPTTGYSPSIDAALVVLSRLSLDDRKRLAIAMLDQLDVNPREQAAVATLLGLIYEDGSVISCWACFRLGEVIRTDAPKGFGRVACAKCDELERESWARRASLEAYEAACDARRDESKERQRIPMLREVAP